MDKIYDLIIIGAGPAGLTASIYAKRAMLDFLFLEKCESKNLPGIYSNHLGIAWCQHLTTFQFQLKSIITIAKN